MGKVLAGRVVKAGEVIRYDKDLDVTAYALAGDGTIEEIQNGHYVYPDEFEVSFVLEFPDEATDGEKFFKDLKQKALEKIITIQDTALFTLLRYVTDAKNPNTSNNFEELFRSLIYEIESNRILAEFILLNSNTTKTFINRVVAEGKSEWIDPIVQLELIKAGYLGKYVNGSSSVILTAAADVGTNPFPEDTVYVTAPSAYVGGAPVRLDLFVEPINQSVKDGKWKKGLFFYKLISMVVVNPKTVACGRLTDYQLLDPVGL